MDNKKNEKIKQIRKVLLLKVNEELKYILKYKSNIKINSRTIPEINKLYSLNDIQLVEKPAIYSHYVKTEEKIMPRVTKSQEKPMIKISRSMNKIRTKNKSRANINIVKSEKKDKVEKASFEEDSVSPLISFFPKKVELGKRKLHQSKAKNKGSIPMIHHKGIKLEKYQESRNAMISHSTRMAKRDMHLNKLIGRITVIKDNKVTEEMIKASIKKLRNYCYQLRKRKKRPKKNNIYSFSKKSLDKNKVKKGKGKKRSGLIKKSDSLLIKFQPTLLPNDLNISRKIIMKSPNLNNSIKNKKFSNISRMSLSPSKHEEKEKKASISLMKKGKNKKGKRSNKDSIKTMGNSSVFESSDVPDVFQIHKKGIPFFHKTTVNINDDEILEKEKKEKKRNDKKLDSKERSQSRKKIKSIEHQPQPIQKQETNNLGNVSKFLNVNYIYNRNNNKKRTKIEMKMNRLQSNKKLTKIEMKKEEILNKSPAIIKLSKVNNGEIQKKIKKRQIKEKKINRNSYISNKTDTNNYRSKENLLNKSAIKK